MKKIITLISLFSLFIISCSKQPDVKPQAKSTTTDNFHLTVKSTFYQLSNWKDIFHVRINSVNHFNELSFGDSSGYVRSEYNRQVNSGDTIYIYVPYNDTSSFTCTINDYIIAKDKKGGINYIVP